jgi:proline iminopeptidase
VTATATGHYLHTPDTTLYYEVRGSAGGVPLIVLNGGPGRSHNIILVSPAWDALARDRTLVFYDQRGTGRSRALQAGDTCTVADQVADLGALRAHLGADRVDLLGHSWGGYLAMAYTARYGTRVRRLVLVDSAAPRIKDTVILFRAVFPDLAERRVPLRAAVARGERGALDAEERLYLSMLCYAPEKRDALLAMADLTDFSADVARALNADLLDADLRSALPRFAQPALVITGRYDMNVAPSVAYGIYKAMPNARFVVFERSGHMPFYEEADAFVETVQRFLGAR